jgi:hypothetical protein
VEYTATVDGSEIRALAKNVNIALFIPRLAVSTARYLCTAVILCTSVKQHSVSVADVAIASTRSTSIATNAFHQCACMQ